eukprot:CAMPEP_0171618178 /NCGR_PEP_ID=MMETSP0990-20121206/14583_1 /TAXON_ID=483369 /ORGANISM="non described non described, Strain CCMP2098" /LENGTH=74 /DNA_ID=CAMNT_0012182915 /DNA_START=48 /DNA_END=272 /DNA_ORIENTATION=+
MRAFSALFLLVGLAVTSAFAPSTPTRWTTVAHASAMPEPQLDAEIIGDIAKMKAEAEERMLEKKKELEANLSKE